MISDRVAFVVFCLFATVTSGATQELEPRAYSASPVGATFLGASLSRSSGAIVTDPTLPLDGVEATRELATLGLGYTFGLLGDLALLTALVPYAWTDVSANVLGTARSVSRSGLADARVRLSVHLRGNPAMRAGEFARTPRRTIVGTSITVVAPSGQYDRAKLINLGNNRWAFKPEAGVSVPMGKWDFDAYGGVWLFAKNSRFFPGALTRTQDALLTLQGHAGYTFRPRFWLAINGAWYAGGGAHIEGRRPGLRMNNSRAGLTLSLPAGGQQSIKIAYSAGTFARAGPNFRTVSVAWQMYWLTKR
jgi:hypothetical protein